MGLFDRIFRNERATPQGVEPHESGTHAIAPLSDAQALERYRYMVKTAPPQTIEQAHAEAFSRLTPEQRRQILAELSNAAPAEERAAAQSTSPDDPNAMGRLATRTEMRQPGFMERVLGGGMGYGGAGLGTSLLGSFAMGALGSMVAQSFFSSLGGVGGGEPFFPAPEAAHGPSPADEQHSDFDADPTDPDMETDLDDADLDVGDADMGGGDFDV